MSSPFDSSALAAAEAAVNRILLDPRYHAPLALIKGFRNGLVYGTKIRFPHALVMTLLFRTATPQQKAKSIITATREHAWNLSRFVLIYKLTCLLLRQLSPPTAGGVSKETSLEPAIGGLVAGYLIFGRQPNSSVAQQIVIYVFARVVLGAAKLAAEKGLVGSSGKSGRGGLGAGWLGRDNENAWPVFAAGSWAAVMWLFRWHPEVLQGSLRGSMEYLYTNAETWHGVRDWVWHNK